MTENASAVAIPEEFRRAIHLESIFMPYARKQRETFCAQRGRFVHYTSAEAALSIVKSKRIWLRNTNCMSDYREVQHGFDMLQSFFSVKANKDAFNQSLDACCNGVAQEAITIFNQWWNDTRFGTYIASISEHDDREDLHGRLSMWRAFGGNTARVAIVFNIPYFSHGATALNINFNPVAYLTNGQLHESLDLIIKNIYTNSEFLRSVERPALVSAVFNMLVAGATGLKHEGFHEEREWRVVYNPKRQQSPLMEVATEVIGGVPQCLYKMPLDVRASDALADLDFPTIFDRIILGPSPYPWPMFEAFTSALSEAGVANAPARVFTSCIPIRA